jgi:hypothetical protein
VTPLGARATSAVGFYRSAGWQQLPAVDDAHEDAKQITVFLSPRTRDHAAG